MSAFTGSQFLLFALGTWAATVVWSYGIARLLLRRATPIGSSTGLSSYTETALQLSVLPSIVIWFLVAPLVAGFGQVVLFLEGVIGLVVSAVLSFIVVTYSVREEHFAVPGQDTG